MIPFLITERDGPVLMVRMNRPEQRNTLSDIAVPRAFVDLCEAINRDDTIRAVILTGAGSAFSAGGDLNAMRDRAVNGRGATRAADHYRRGIQLIPRALYNLEAPIIAAINGPAIGAGLDLACMCDIRIACETALFAESFVRLGLVAGDGGAWLLPRIIGYPRATLMSLTGQRIDAQKALEWDLVTEVVPVGGLEAAAIKLAHSIAENPSHALRMTKRLLREGGDMSLDSLLELSAALQALAQQTSDHREAVEAALEKRKPIFSDC